MTERPIIFTGESVRAILNDAKTQSRRVCRPSVLAILGAHGEPGDRLCPYGAPGDRLWVREAWYCDHAFAGSYDKTMNAGRVGPDVAVDRAACEAEWRDLTYYRADGEAHEQMEDHLDLRWRSPLYMPRWASRLTLEVTAVRIERLQSITEEDARAEGVTCRVAYARLWDAINRKPRCSWSENPWVWAVSFRLAAPGPGRGV